MAASRHALEDRSRTKAELEKVKAIVRQHKPKAGFTAKQEEGQDVLLFSTTGMGGSKVHECVKALKEAGYAAERVSGYTWKVTVPHVEHSGVEQSGVTLSDEQVKDLTQKAWADPDGEDAQVLMDALILTGEVTESRSKPKPGSLGKNFDRWLLNARLKHERRELERMAAGLRKDENAHNLEVIDYRRGTEKYPVLVREGTVMVGMAGTKEIQRWIDSSGMGDDYSVDDSYSGGTVVKPKWYPEDLWTP